MDVDKLKKIGGNEWKNYGLHRIYFNNLARLIGLTRNIHTFTLNGETIDNKDGMNIQNAMLDGKFWYDVEKDKFYSQNLNIPNYKLKDMIIEKIESLIEPDILEDELFEI